MIIKWSFNVLFCHNLLKGVCFRGVKMCLHVEKGKSIKNNPDKYNYSQYITYICLNNINIYYHLFLAGNSPVIFSLNSTNGLITVSDSTQLDPTSTPSYSLTIQVNTQFIILHQLKNYGKITILRIRRHQGYHNRLFRLLFS